MKRARDRLIVALDVPGAGEARTLIEALGDSVGVYKIGLELMFAGGIALATELASRGSASCCGITVAPTPTSRICRKCNRLRMAP